MALRHERRILRVTAICHEHLSNVYANPIEHEHCETRRFFPPETCSSYGWTKGCRDQPSHFKPSVVFLRG
jgi:hypothetical protein